MATTVATGQAFMNWLDIYDNAGNTNEDINETDAMTSTFFKEGETANPSTTMDLLIKFPFLAAYFGYLDVNGDVVVSILHHVCKKGPTGIEFDGVTHQAHGIVDILFPSQVVQIPTSLFIPDITPTELINTPILQDFIDSAGDKALISVLVPTTVTAAMVTAGLDANGHPLPQIMPRKGGLIPPFLASSFMASRDPNAILSDCVIKLHTFAVANNIAAGPQDDWWHDAFPTLQRLWYLSTIPATAIKQFVLVSPALTQTIEMGILKKVQADENLIFGTTLTVMGPMLPPPPVPMDPNVVMLLERILDANARMNDTNARIIELRGGGDGEIESSGSDGNGRTKFQKRFHLMHQNFILFASASSATEMLETEPSSTFKQFVESPEKQALSLAQFAINQQRGANHTVDIAFTKMLFGASFLDSEGGQTKGLSIFFMVPTPFIIHAPRVMNSAELELRTATSKLSDSQISKLTSSQIRIPKDEHEFKATLKNFLTVIDFVFSKNSIIYVALEKLQTQVTNFHKEFNKMVANDRRFIAQFMQSIDSRIQKFFDTCSTAKSSADVAYIFLDWSQEVNDFIFDRKRMLISPMLWSTCCRQQTTL